jgi:hypothetical protein
MEFLTGPYDKKNNGKQEGAEDIGRPESEEGQHRQRGELQDARRQFDDANGEALDRRGVQSNVCEE